MKFNFRDRGLSSLSTANNDVAVAVAVEFCASDPGYTTHIKKHSSKYRRSEFLKFSDVAVAVAVAVDFCDSDPGYGIS